MSLSTCWPSTYIVQATQISTNGTTKTTSITTNTQHHCSSVHLVLTQHMWQLQGLYLEAACLPVWGSWASQRGPTVYWYGENEKNAVFFSKPRTVSRHSNSVSPWVPKLRKCTHKVWFPASSDVISQGLLTFQKFTVLHAIQRPSRVLKSAEISNFDKPHFEVESEKQPTI